MPTVIINPQYAGQTVYARSLEADATKAAAIEVTGTAAGMFQVADSVWHTAALPAGVHNIVFRMGDIDSTASSDPVVGTFYAFAYDGTSEVFPEIPILSDIGQTPIPPSRTWVPVRKNGGLVADTIYIAKSELPALFAIDFRNDLPSNGRVATVGSVTQTGGPTDALSFASTARDHSLAKVLINSTVANSFQVTCPVVYSSGSPGTGTAVVALVVEDG